jgi:hypothetical protein
MEMAHVSRRDFEREVDGKRWKNGKTGFWVERRERETGFGSNFPSTSRPLPVFSQTWNTREKADYSTFSLSTPHI